MKLSEFMALPYAKRVRVLRGVGVPTGEWLTTRPTEPGWYFVADKHGVCRSIRQLVTRASGVAEAGIPSYEPGWQGFWWSEPIDMLAGPSDAEL